MNLSMFVSLFVNLCIVIANSVCELWFMCLAAAVSK